MEPDLNKLPQPLVSELKEEKMQVLLDMVLQLSELLKVPLMVLKEEKMQVLLDMVLQ